VRRLSLVLLVTVPLAFSACGGDNNDNEKAQKAGATGATATQTTNTTATTKTGRKAHGKSKSGKAKSGGGATTTTEGATPKGSTTTIPTITNGLIPHPYDTAKKVCGGFLPLSIMRAVDRGKRSAKSVAKDYSKGWKPEQRKAAYKGCIAGLKARIPKK
jgi:hypothetical protein